VHSIFSWRDPMPLLVAVRRLLPRLHGRLRSEPVPFPVYEA
jgi:hypothetical protein